MGHSLQRLAARPAHGVLGGRRPGAIASAILALSVLTACGEDQTGPDEPLAIVPDRVTLTQVGERFSFTLRGGDADEAVWSGGDTTVFVVDQGGTVTARGYGVAYVAAATRQQGVQAVVEVTQVPTALEALGDGQSAGPGLSLLEPVGVRVLDAGGMPVGGTRIRFEPEQGSGRAEPAAAETDSLGLAWTVWTLGRAPGRQALRMVADEGGASTRIEATALDPEEAAASVEAVSGEYQWVLPGRALPEPVVVQVLDETERPVWGARVRFEPEAGSGRASPNAVETDSLGMAAAEWTLGNQLGPQRLVAVAGGMTAELRATAVSDEGVCNRTPEVSAAIAREVGVESCAEVTETLLGQLWALRLSDMKATKLMSGDLDGLGSLGRLTIFRNQLSELPPSIFDGLVSLRYLYLHWNGLSELPPDVFDGLVALERLDISSNALTELPPDIFDGLAALEGLRVDFNELTELPPGIFDGLVALKFLNLDHNRLAKLPAGAFDGLGALEGLRIDFNELTELPPGIFDGLGALERLRIEYNRLAQLPAGTFDATPKLARLSLHWNGLGRLPPGIFGALSELEELHLEHNGLTELPTGVFAGTPKLSVLTLFRNGLERLPRGVFAGLSELKYADFSRNPGTPFSLRPEFVRVDGGDPLAPGPARVAVRLPLGAPARLDIPVSVQKGAVSQEVVSVLPGDTMSTPFVVSPGGEAGTAVRVRFGRPPELARLNYAGLDPVPGEELVLFGASDNRSPVAPSRVPAHRMSAGGPSARLDLEELFDDPDGDSLVFEVATSVPGVVDARIEGGALWLEPGSPDTTEVEVTATDPGGLWAKQRFRTWVAPAPDPDAFNIELDLGPGFTPEAEAAVRRAADRWMEVVTGDLPDLPVEAVDLAAACSQAGSGARLVGVVDDLLIRVMYRATHERYAGVAGACARRAEVEEAEHVWSDIPFIAYAGLSYALNTPERLYKTALHEIGHALGIGSGWEIQDRATDPHFAGPRAVAAFDAAGGAHYTGGKVPVYSRSHWRPSVIPGDIMTPGGGYALVTAITVQALADRGHVVDASRADPYTLPMSAQGDAWAGSVAGAGMGDGEEAGALACRVVEGPVVVVDADGRVVRVDRP